MRRAAAVAVLVGIAAPAAFAQVEGTSSTGVPSLGTIKASTFGSSLFVTVLCADGGADCSGDVSARSLSPARRIDSQPYTVPTGLSETLRLPIKGAAYNRLRATGRLRVSVTLTSLGGASDERTLTVTARKKKKPKKRP